MNRSTSLCLIGALAASLGVSGDGCIGSMPFGGFWRGPPVIIPDGPIMDTLRRTFTVELRDYPETDSITWDFGDGAVTVGLSVATGRTVTHEFAKAGTYQVVVYLFSAADPFGGGARLIAAATLPVDVTGANVPPTAAFVIEDTFDGEDVPLPLTKRFDASASRDPDGTIVSYTWDFGDGALGEGRTAEHTFSRSAWFVVRLTVIDDRGGTDGATKTILANTTPVASFIITEDPADALTFTFDASASNDYEGGIASYRWDFGDDSSERTGREVTHTYAVPDDYVVVLTVTDEVGATATSSRVLDVTGSDPFVRSVSPDVGEVDTVVSDVVIDGENFETGVVVRLKRGNQTITAQSATVENDTTIRMTIDLTGAEPGDYDVVVENPDGATARLSSGFRVVTQNRVRLTTDFGDIVLELVDDAPITTENFLQYVEGDFYDGTIFHRIVPDFVVQGGGYLPGMIPQEGQRDPIPNEFDPDRSNVRGTVAMAKLGGDPDSATSQFFVNLADNSDSLDNQNGGFTVFANVIEGMDVVDAMAAVPLNGEQPIDDILLVRAQRE